VPRVPQEKQRFSSLPLTVTEFVWLMPADFAITTFQHFLASFSGGPWRENAFKIVDSSMSE
jgi:hypothetical protein